MSRRQIEHAYYTFNPATNTVVVPRIIKQERLMLITNTTTGTVIYNFADNTLNAYSFTIDNTIGNAPTTTIVLKYNCSAMAATDKLAIISDEIAETTTFTEPLLDAVNKLRVAPPQSLIDTDFEYGVQASKWEALVLNANYPSFFSRATGGNSFDVTSISGDGVSPRSTITVVVAVPQNALAVGDVISVQETLNPLAEGTFPVTAVSGDGYSFSYVASGVVTGAIKDGTLSTVTGGGIYENAHIPGGSVAAGLNSWSAYSDGATPSTVTVTTNTAHGLLPGTPILIGNQNPACTINGNWRIFNVSSPNQFKFVASGLITAGAVTTTGVGLYCKPNGYVQHRPFDGGVILSTQDNVCGTRVIRQTRRYFRYQSGKSIQFSTGVKFTPTFDVDSITVAGVLPGNQIVTVQTIQDHGIQPGAYVKISGIITTGSYNPWNGSFRVTAITGTNSFQYTMFLTQALNAQDQFPGGIDITATIYEWDGAATRCGLYNDQNGFFFEYDGTYLYAVRRYSKKEMFGKIAVTNRSNVVTGTGTRFRKQLTVGDQIVIKGANYNIIEIASDTNLKISPAYKGESNSTSRYVLTQEIRVPQTEWNVDRMDGTGPSGYTLDTTKMQMAYIDYTWYGAGFIRFGFRATEGNIVYCHKMPNNNQNTEAYMRSGNLPARYEAINSPFFFTKLKAGGNGIVGSALQYSEILMYVDSVRYWPDNGYLMIKDDQAAEIVSYNITDKNYNATAQGYPVNIARRQPMTSYIGGTAVNLTGTSTSVNFYPDSTIQNGIGTAQVAICTITNTCAPVISHWGSSVIMDGRFDDDKNFIFTAGMQRFMNIQGSGTVTARITAKSAASGTATLTTAANHSLQVGYQMTVSGVNTTSTITNKQYTVATTTALLQTSGPHNFITGQQVTISGVGAPFDGTYTINATPTSNTFSFLKSYATNVVSTVVNSVAALAVENTTYNGTYTVTAVTSNTIQYTIANVNTISTSIVTPNGSVIQTFGSTAVARPLMSIRIAPSADNGIGRNYGIRELINTMQLQLSSIGILSTGTFLIQGIYNAASFPSGVNIPSDWELQRIPGGSLAQVIYHDGTGTTGTTVTNPLSTISGGDQAFAFYTDNGGGSNYSTTNFDLSKVRDLGTSILSGNGTPSAPGFPNGPDILTIVATNIGLTSADISARLSWTEAQA
jgi:hypothetical protein